MGRSYVIDFNTMQQINEDSGTVRPVQRKSTPASSAAGGSVAGKNGFLFITKCIFTFSNDAL